MPNPYPTQPLWPTAWGGCTVHGRQLRTNGHPVTGSIIFTMSPVVVQYLPILADGQRRAVFPADIEVALDDLGAFTVVLPATDAPGIVPVEWTYAVYENWDGGREYSIKAPTDGDVDVADYRPVQDALGRLPQRVSSDFTRYDGGFLT